MTAYELTSSAESDLRGIIRYTRLSWGDTQVRRYIAQLEHGIERLAAGEGAFKDMRAIHPALRMHIVGSSLSSACHARTGPH